MPVGWGIIGCGQLADAQIAPAIRQIPDARLVGFLSRDEAKGRQYAAKHGAPKVYARIEDLLADPEVQAVYIVNPPAFHCPQTLAAAAAGRHVMVDKPMSMNVSEARRMVDACRAAGVKLACGFMMRYNPCNLKLRDMLRAGELGALVHIHIQASYELVPSANWRLDPALSGGGSLMDMGSHAIDLLRRFGGEIAEVAGHVANRVHSYPVEDTAVALVRFESGATAFMDASFSEKHVPRRVEAYGSKGSVYLHHTIGRRHNGEMDLFLDGRMQRIEVPPANPYVGSIGEMTRAILEDRDPEVSGEEGLRNMQIIAAIYESSKTGRFLRP
jgi:predicted dehydrogenase